VRTRSWVVVTLAVAVLSGSAARAQDCAPPEGSTGGSLSQQGASERLAFLTRVLGEQARKTQNWTLAWGATYGLLTVIQLAAVGPTEPSARVDWYVGAFTSVVGAAFVLIDPPQVLNHGAEYVDRAARATPENTCALLEEGEQMLKDGASHQAFNTAWYSHVANVLFNVGVGLFLWLGYDRLVSGLVNFGIGAALGEATIFTAPTGLIDAWDSYRTGSKPQAVHFHVAPAVGAGVVGVRLGLTF
jgi:hypothetical protein